MPQMEIRNKFKRNEARLKQLATSARYCYRDHRAPSIVREAACLEAMQARLAGVLGGEQI